MITRFAFLSFVTLSLVACSSWMGDDEDPPLPGERLSVMQLQKKLEPDQITPAQSFTAPTPWMNEIWPLAGGYANHAMQHLALSTEPLEKIWSVDIGAGSSKTNPLTAQPVIADGRLYALDADGELSAYNINNGKRIWQVFAGARDEDDTAIGGGLGYANGTLYVTNGYAEMLAIKGDDGAEYWRIPLPAPARAAPIVLDGRVYVITLDNRLLALNPANGAQLWTYRGVSEGKRLLGAASPAVDRDLVIAPFSSGELFAFRVENGSVAWSDNLAPPIRVGGLESLSDIRALPIIDNGLVIAMSYAGRLIAIDERSGNRVWQRDIGGEVTPWVAGPYLFVLSSDNQLIALNRDNGAIRWVLPLPRFDDPDARTGTVVWNGPIYAGGRLILAGSGGRAVDVDPATGNVTRDWDMGDTPAVTPIVAGQVLYFLDQGGTLSAWK